MSARGMDEKRLARFALTAVLALGPAVAVA